MPGSVIKNHLEFDGGHKFLAEELLQPMANRCDVGRTVMFTNHISQTVVLDNPERPRVFSTFENAFGDYTSAIKRLPADATIVSVFEKNALQSVYALRYADGKMDVHFAAPVRHLTENYGYRLTSEALDGKEAGHELAGGTVIQGWSCTDADGNFAYGANLRTLYGNFLGLTYEDGFVVCESAAENQLSHTSIDDPSMMLNANDATVNLYGEPERHQSFPEIGQEIKNGIIMARRRINHESILFDLSARSLSRVNWDTDTVLYGEGTIVDIDVYSNLSTEELGKHPYNQQILHYHKKWLEFREWFTGIFGEVVAAGVEGTYSDDVAHWYQICRDTVSARWRHERSEFDGVVVRFTVAKRNKATVGSKVSNRFGGKSVISAIIPDAQMPHTADGKYPHALVNSLGVVNRLNPSQLFESELNFIADKVAEQMRGAADVAAALEHLLSFYDIVAPGQAGFMRTIPVESALAVAAEISAGNQWIYIAEPPFSGSLSTAALELAYETFGVERLKFEGIEEPQILGSNYYIKLRHEPLSKFSARSAKHLSIRGVPTKNSRGLRMGTEHHSTTPPRLGEQELQNLLIANKPEEIKRFLRIYATDDVSREGAIADLLLRSDPFSTARIEPRGSGTTRPVAGFNALLESIGLRLEGDDEPESAYNQSINKE